MKELLYFDKMITPKIITFIYWLLLVVVILGGLKSIFDGQFIMGLGMLIGGSIGVRVWCELMIVFFKMNEAMQELKNK